MPRMPVPKLLLCDVQTKFRPLVHNMETVISKCAMLNNACNILGIHVGISEQYPEKLGTTVPEIIKRESTTVFSKKKFSMMGSLPLDLHHSTAIVCGIEAHVCVLQTVLHLSRDAHPESEIFVVCDAVSSQRTHDRAVALRQMAALPQVTITTAESVLFHLMETAEHPKFKDVSALVKENNATCPNEFRGDNTW